MQARAKKSRRIALTFLLENGILALSNDGLGKPELSQIIFLRSLPKWGKKGGTAGCAKLVPKYR